MMHSTQTYWTKRTYKNSHYFACMLIVFVHAIGSGFFTNGSYLGTHGWNYYWGYKQLAFFCLNTNLICISFF